MAIRIYDQTMGQLAGVTVPTTGFGAITRNGQEAYAQMVVTASGVGLTGDAAGEGNVVGLTGATISDGSITFDANTESVVIDTQGFEGASLTVSGFGTATLQVQWSNLPTTGFVAGLVTTVGTTTTSTNITANGQYTASSGGRYMRIITTAYTSGPIVVTPTLYAGAGSGTSGGGGGGDVNLIQIDGNDVDIGAGAVGVGTQRFTLASNDPAVSALTNVQDTFGAITANQTVIFDDSGAALDWTAPVPVIGEDSNGATADPNPVIIGGRASGGTVRSMAVDTNGAVSVNVISGAPGADTVTQGTSPWIVAGASADDAVASGNPVQVAGKYVATLPTYTDGDTAQLHSTPKGHLIVSGATAEDAAAPAAADTYPVPVGGVFTTSIPTYTTGDRVQAQFDISGNLKSILMGTAAAVGATYTSQILARRADSTTTFPLAVASTIYDGTNITNARAIAGSFGSAVGVAAVEQAGSPSAYISTATTTTVKSGAGIWHKFIVGTLGAGSNAVVYDNTAGSGTILATIDTSTAKEVTLNLAFATGLTIVTAGGTPALITVVYR